MNQKPNEKFLPWRYNTFVGSSPTQGSMYFFLKSDLKWACFQLLLYIFLIIWIKYITRHFKRTNYREKKYCLEWGLNPRSISGQNYRNISFIFLVQVKMARSPFEINWPLEWGLELLPDNSCSIMHPITNNFWGMFISDPTDFKRYRTHFCKSLLFSGYFCD